MKQPTPLAPGDEIRVIAPAMSWPKKRIGQYVRAVKHLERAGYTVSLGKNIRNIEYFGSASVKDRIDDLHAAYADPKVKAVIALRGGWNTNDMLPLIDWELLKKNPKPFIGYSDIGILLEAITACTGQVSYLGPNLAVLGGKELWQYSFDNLIAALSGESFTLRPSPRWAVPRAESHRAPRWKVLRQGEAKGVLRGGNVNTVPFTHGTSYQLPYTADYILVLEDDDEAGRYTLYEFSRRLESMLEQPGARKYLRGLAIGRFLPDSKVRLPDVRAMLEVRNLGNIPIVYGLDFGHTLPMCTLPLGAQAELKAKDGRIEFVLNA